MKGVILAGGLGSRLYPLTKVTNKHLRPVYDRPMVYYPIETLVKAGVTDILLVTGGNNAGDFLRLLGNGKQFGLKHINYTYQEGEGGIAQALSLAEHFADGDKIVVILGDNIIEADISPQVRRFRTQETGARLLLKKVSDPERFGVATVRGNRITSIIEKPRRPKSDLAVVGIYMYDADVFNHIRTLKPSRRGELEITDVNNWYLKRGDLEYDVLPGYWTDAGTLSLFTGPISLPGKKGGRANEKASRYGRVRLHRFQFHPPCHERTSGVFGCQPGQA